jgi:thiamine kinase-like enzyme
MRTVFEILGKTEFEPKLIHGDLCPPNILVENDVITGIIDWSDSGVLDPAIDIGYMFMYYGPAFTEKVLDAYGDRSLLPRAALYSMIIPCDDLDSVPENMRQKCILLINNIPHLLKLHSRIIKKLV